MRDLLIRKDAFTGSERQDLWRLERSPTVEKRLLRINDGFIQYYVTLPWTEQRISRGLSE